MKSFLLENKSTVLLWGILIANLIIGGIFLNSSPIGLDEPFSIFHAQMDISDIVSHLKGGNNPPLYEIVLHFWIKVFGISPISVRFPSLVFSIGTLFFTFKIADRISDTKDAFFAILLMSFSNYYIYFTHEARAYSFFLLLTMLLIYLAISITERKGSKKAEFIAFGIVATLLLYSHYFGLFVFIFQSFLFVLINRKERIVLRYFLLTFIGTLILFSPYILETYSRFMDSSINGTWVQATENLGNLHDMIFWFTNKNKSLYALVLILLYCAIWKLFHQSEIANSIKFIGKFFIVPVFFLISISIFFSIPLIWRLTEMKLVTFLFVTIIFLSFIYFSIIYKNGNTLKLLIIGSFFIPLVLFFTVSFYIPIWVDRYLIFILPSFYITVSLATQHLFKGVQYYASVIILICMMGYSFDITSSDHGEDSKMVRYVKELATDKSTIVINPKQYELTFTYHFDRTIFSNYASFHESMESKGVYSIYNIRELEGIQPKLGSHLVYVDAFSEFLYPNNGVYKRINHDYELKDEKTFEKGIHVSEFVKKVQNIK